MADQQQRLPVPKFQMGDTVWAWYAHKARQQSACPTCAGTGRVQVVGTDKLAFCPDDCSHGKLWGEDPVETYKIIGPLTIGLIRSEVARKKSPTDCGMFDNVIDTDDYLIETKVEYMAHETGVGSGSIHYEEKLCVSRDEAVAAAEAHGAVPAYARAPSRTT